MTMTTIFLYNLSSTSVGWLCRKSGNLLLLSYLFTIRIIFLGNQSLDRVSSQQKNATVSRTKIILVYIYKIRLLKGWHFRIEDLFTNYLWTKIRVSSIDRLLWSLLTEVKSIGKNQDYILSLWHLFQDTGIEAFLVHSEKIVKLYRVNPFGEIYLFTTRFFCVRT